jgi:hypothetical protein
MLRYRSYLLLQPVLVLPLGIIGNCLGAPGEKGRPEKRGARLIVLKKIINYINNFKSTTTRQQAKSGLDSARQFSHHKINKGRFMTDNGHRPSSSVSAQLSKGNIWNLETCVLNNHI